MPILQQWVITDPRGEIVWISALFRAVTTT